MTRVLHVSDPHLRRDDANIRGWLAFERLVASAPPALVINTGDLVLDAPEREADHSFAAECAERLGVEMLSLPGNHDIGDGPPAGAGPSEHLLRLFETRHGPAHWLRRLSDWSLVGANAMLFGSAHSAAEAEWDWLETALAAESGRPIALFVHKPPFLSSPDEEYGGSATMPDAARLRFWNLVKRYGVCLIGCGHRHEYRSILADGVQIIHAPTTSMLLSEVTPPMFPVAWPGCIEYFFVGRSVLHRPIMLQDILA